MAQYRTVTEFLTRIRQAYTKAREKYTLLNDRLDALNDQWKKELARGWRDVKEKATAIERYERMKADYKGKIAELVSNTNAEYQAITADCEAVFGEYDRATGRKIDFATIELIKSGILRPDEIPPLIADFENNSAMLRIIGNYAYNRGKAENNDELLAIGSKYKDFRFPYREHIDTLIMWGQKAMREDRVLSDGIAKVYDEQADRIFADAEHIYITVSENE